MKESIIKKILLEEAKQSLLSDDVPVGALIIENDKIISKAHNTREKNKKITGHAEINAVEKACKKKKTWHLDNCELYVTLEPCTMCLEIIKQARIKKIYYYAKQEKITNQKEIELIKKENNLEFSTLLKQFFKNKRK
ncbi:MAG: nucleoside deaminase [Bacilli bacterium]|nr:nucleoside deaminase [Bacilli bacterium]